MARGLTFMSFYVFVTRAYFNDLSVTHTGKAKDKFAAISSGHLEKRALAASPLQYASLDNTTLGKTHQLVNAPSMGIRLISPLAAPRSDLADLKSTLTSYQPQLRGAIIDPSMVVPCTKRANRRALVCVRATFDPKLFEEHAPIDKFDGTKLKIVEYPSPILRAPNAEITEFDDKLAQLCKEMLTVMYGSSGVGVAAPQVGLNLQLFVYNPNPDAPGPMKKLGERVVVNPKILKYCYEVGTDEEGCLSSRGFCCQAPISRATELQVEYQDMKGNLQTKKLRGFEAVVFQHEYDHIQGVLHLDRQLPEDRQRIKPYLDVLIDQHGPGGALELDPKVMEKLQPAVGAAPKSLGFGSTGAKSPSSTSAKTPSPKKKTKAKRKR